MYEDVVKQVGTIFELERQETLFYTSGILYTASIENWSEDPIPWYNGGSRSGWGPIVGQHGVPSKQNPS